MWEDQISHCLPTSQPTNFDLVWDLPSLWPHVLPLTPLALASAILHTNSAGSSLASYFPDWKGLPNVLHSTSFRGLIKCHPLSEALMLLVNGQRHIPNDFWLFLLLIFCTITSHLYQFFIFISFYYIINVFNPFISPILRREAGTAEVLSDE